jgi:hypothetical protein
MPRSSAGKWVARAGATGQSRSYRGQTPVNWYAALVVIVLLGVLSVLWASYVYRHPTSTSTSTTDPTTSTTWYAGINFNICGITQTSLASNATTASKSDRGIFTTGSGVLTVAPKTDKEAGKNAVLGKFVSGYPGLTLTSTELVMPSGKHKTFQNGDTCAKGTPDAGKIASIHVTYWPSAFTSKEQAKTVTGDPATLRFSDNQLITVGFVPTGTKLGKNASVVTALLHSTTGGSTSTPTTSSTATTTPTSTSAPAGTSTSTPVTSSTPTTTKK